MTYQVKIETAAGDLEDYGQPFTSKEKAIQMARIAARETVLENVTRFHVDCVETDMAVFTQAVRQ